MKKRFSLIATGIACLFAAVSMSACSPAVYTPSVPETDVSQSEVDTMLPETDKTPTTDTTSPETDKTPSTDTTLPETDKTPSTDTTLPETDKTPSETEEKTDYNVTGNIDFDVAYCNLNLKRPIGGIVGDLYSGLIDIDAFWDAYHAGVDVSDMSPYGVYFSNKIVDTLDSWTELNQFIPDFHPDYDDEFFNNKSLIVYVMGGAPLALKNIEIFVEDNIATVKIDVTQSIFDFSQEWALILEVDKEDFASISEVVLDEKFV